MESTHQQYSLQRQQMVSRQIESRGIKNRDLLEAMLAVPRHHFVGAANHKYAYGDFPLAIGFGQTISQPYIVAFMIDCLKVSKSHRVLEIGFGCGYQTAVLANLVKYIYGMELLSELVVQARFNLSSFAYSNIELRQGNGYDGWEEHAPFDRIIVAAAAPKMPMALVEQLADDGLMIIPVGTNYQNLVLVQKSGDQANCKNVLPVRFVPLIDRAV